MQRYTLPFDLDQIKEGEEVSVDMSSLNFDVPDDRQKRSSFIFLRNAGVKAELDFSGCSYKDKVEFLLLYLQEDIDVNAEILSSTWIEILSAKDGGGVVLPSILTSSEINQFIKDNKDFINEIYQLINSLPIFSMMCSVYNGSLYDINDFEKTDFDGVKITNFSKLSAFDAFSLLIDGSTPGKFYEKLFIKGEPHIIAMMERLPFLNLISALMAGPDVQAKIVTGINQMLVPPKVEPKEGKEEPLNE